MRERHIVTVGTLLLTILSATGGAADESARLLEQCVERIESLERATSKFRASGNEIVTLTHPTRPTANLELHKEITYARSGDRQRLTVREGAATTADGAGARPPTTYVTAPEATFSVTEKGPGRYVMEQLGAGETSAAGVLRTASELLVFNGNFDHRGMSLGQFLRSPQFVSRKVARVSEDAEELIRIDFEAKRSSPGDPGIRGWLKVAPARQGVLHSYEYSPLDQPKAITQATIQYVASEGGAPPTPVKVVLRDQNPNGVTHVRTLTIQSFEGVDTPADQFSPAAFGLGDLAAPSKPAIRGSVWFLMLAALALGASVVLYRMSRATGKRSTNMS